MTTLGATASTTTFPATASDVGADASGAAATAASGAASALASHEADTTSIHGIANTANLYVAAGTDVAVADGGTGASTAAGARTNLGLVPGTDVQAQDAELAALAGLTSAADKLPYFTGSGTASVADFTAAGRALVDDASAAAQATTLGLGTGDSPQHAAIELGHATDTTIARSSAGVLTVEGNRLFAVGGTDVPVADGGTGSSTASDARTALGLAIGTNVQAYSAELANVAGWTTVVKASDESVTSSTTVQNDDELFFAATSGGVYEWELVLIYASPAGAGVPDLKITLGATEWGACTLHGIATGDTLNSVGFLTNASQTQTYGTAAANRVMYGHGTYLSAGNTFRLAWAQNTSDTNATIVRAGSLLRWRRVV